MDSESVVLSEVVMRDIERFVGFWTTCRMEEIPRLKASLAALVRDAVAEDRRQRAEKVCDFAALCAADLLSDVEDRPSIETVDEWREAVANRIRSVAAEATREKAARIAELEAVWTAEHATVMRLGTERDQLAAQVQASARTDRAEILRLRADLDAARKAIEEAVPIITAQYASLGYLSVARARCAAWLSAHGPEPTGVGSE